MAALLYFLALTLRLVPLFGSNLPLIDGFPLARIARDVQDTGRWTIDDADVNSYNQRMPVYPILWALASLLGGVDVLRGLALVMPFVTSLAVVATFVLVRDLTGHRGVAFAAGLFVAVFGSFVLLTAAISKESLGLVVLPLTLLAFLRRKDPKWRAISAGLLLFLPLLHHLTFLMTVGIVTALLVVEHHRRIVSGGWRVKDIALDTLTGPATALAGAAYYSAVNLQLYRSVTTADELALFLAIAFLFAVAATRLARTSPTPWRERKPIARGPLVGSLLVSGAMIGAVLYNWQRPVFAATMPTQDLFLVLLPAIALLGALAAIGFGVLKRTSGRELETFVAITIAPLTVVAFGFLRGLDPLSFALVYRSLDFLDFGLAMAVGIGIAVLWKGASRMKRTAMAALLVAALVATTPMAYASESVFGVQNVTYEYEFAAIAFASSSVGRFGSDQRLADVGAWWFHLDSDRSAMLRLDRGESMAGYGLVLVEGRWTTTGAQIHPAPNLVLDPASLDRFLWENNVVYAGGLAGSPVYVVLPSAKT